MQTDFNIPALTCSSCSGKIKDEISSLKGVNQINMDLKTQIVKVDYNPLEIQPAEIKRKITGLGFEVIS